MDRESVPGRFELSCLDAVVLVATFRACHRARWCRRVERRLRVGPRRAPSLSGSRVPPGSRAGFTARSGSTPRASREGRVRRDCVTGRGGRARAAGRPVSERRRRSCRVRLQRPGHVRVRPAWRLGPAHGHRAVRVWRSSGLGRARARRPGLLHDRRPWRLPCRHRHFAAAIRARSQLNRSGPGRGTRLPVLGIPIRRCPARPVTDGLRVGRVPRSPRNLLKTTLLRDCDP
jgi:hypothetical protein